MFLDISYEKAIMRATSSIAAIATPQIQSFLLALHLTSFISTGCCSLDHQFLIIHMFG